MAIMDQALTVSPIPTPQEPRILWLSDGDPRTASSRMLTIPVYRAPIEQYTETLPRRWWQLKAATRIRIRRVQPSTVNCRCAGSWL